MQEEIDRDGARCEGGQCNAANALGRILGRKEGGEGGEGRCERQMHGFANANNLLANKSTGCAR